MVLPFLPDVRVRWPRTFRPQAWRIPRQLPTECSLLISFLVAISRSEPIRCRVEPVSISLLRLSFHEGRPILAGSFKASWSWPICWSVMEPSRARESNWSEFTTLDAMTQPTPLRSQRAGPIFFSPLRSRPKSLTMCLNSPDMISASYCPVDHERYKTLWRDWYLEACAMRTSIGCCADVQIDF